MAYVQNVRLADVLAREGLPAGCEDLVEMTWQEYKRAPVMPSVFDASYQSVVRGWALLADETDYMFDALKRYIHVEFVHGQPYKTAAAMFADITDLRLLVSKDHNEHPIFTEQTNLRFRAVHDTFGHYEAKSAFTLAGELAAYREHRDSLPESVWKYLFVEVLGQAVVAAVEGQFPVQKCYQPSKETFKGWEALAHG